MLNGSHLGKRIRDIRMEKKISIQKLADSTGVQRSFINQLESGDRLPSFGTLIAIINTLEVSADELLYDYIKNPNPEVVECRLSRKLQNATEQQIKRIEAHILLDLNLSEEDDYVTHYTIH
jgi:transcriptional regulator with XRE-family HTH domain